MRKFRSFLGSVLSNVSDKSEDRNSGEFTQEMRGEFGRSFVDIKLKNTSGSREVFILR